MIVYIAGKFRGPTTWAIENNVRLAESMILDVARKGHIPMCPHTMYRYFDKCLPDQFWLDATMELLRRSDAILMLPGWEQSEGARAEHAFAVENGLDVYTLETLPDEEKEG